jgi:hypothetical protein
MKFHDRDASGLRPLKMLFLLGPQTAICAYARSNVTESLASLSRFGV